MHASYDFTRVGARLCIVLFDGVLANDRATVGADDEDHGPPANVRFTASRIAEELDSTTCLTQHTRYRVQYRVKFW